MTDERKHYVAGEDVTELLAPASGTVAVAIEVLLPGAQLDRLDAFSEATGRSYEDIIQDALHCYPPLRAFNEQAAIVRPGHEQ